MKSLKEVLFTNALYCKDKAREWKNLFGEFDNAVYDSYKAQYNILLNVITEADLLPEWDAHLKTVFLQREGLARLEKEDSK